MQSLQEQQPSITPEVVCGFPTLQSSGAMDEVVRAAHSVIVGTCLDASETQ